VGNGKHEMFVNRLGLVGSSR